MSTEELLETFRRKKAEAAANAGATVPDSMQDVDGPHEAADSASGPSGEHPKVDAAKDARHPSPRGPVGAGISREKRMDEDRLVDDAEGPLALQDMSIDDLQGYAKENKIPIADEASKDDIIEAIEAAEGSPSASEPGSGPEAAKDSEAEVDGPSMEAQPPTPEQEPSSTDEPSNRPAQTAPSEDPVVDAAHRERPPQPTPLPAKVESLVPLDPSLGLAARIREDPMVMEKVWEVPRMASVGVALLGIVLLAVDRLVYALQGNILLGPMRLTWLALTLTLVGAVAAGVLWFLAKESVVPVRFARDQATEWQRATERVQLIKTARWVSIAIAASAGLLIIIAVAIRPDARSLPFIVFWLSVMGLAIIAGVAAQAMHRSAVRTYMQTMVLWILEQTGVPGQSGARGMDPRIPSVMRSLDGLLSQLPDKAVREFMATPEASAYLELMDSLPEA